MKSILDYVVLVLELLLTITVAVGVAYQGDTLNLLIFAWFALSTLSSTWFLARKIDAVRDSLGFGVSVPASEMPRVMEEISRKIKAQVKAGGSRKGRGVLDELNALDDETP